MMLSLYALLVASALSFTCATRISRRAHNQQKDCYSIYDGLPLVRLNARNAAEHVEMNKAVLELQCTEASEDDFLETMAICGKDSVATLKEKFGQQVEVVEEDAGGSLRLSSGTVHAFSGMSSSFYSDYRSYEDRLGRVQALVSASGGVASLEEVGRSIEGRPIYTVRIRGAGYVSGGPRVVANFQQHAREWIAGMTGVYAVEQAIARAQAEPEWLAGAELMLVPLANPDGIVYSETSDRYWRKNRRTIQGSSCKGVDTNRNWSPGWEANTGYCGQTYSGTSAFSEPETQAVRSVINESFTTIHMDVHSYSQLIVVPFGYTRVPHPRRAEMDVIGRAMQQAIKDTHGVNYQYGGSELIGWSKGIARDYNAGTSDGFSFLFELRPSGSSGGGFAPPANQILPTAEEFVAAMNTGIDAVVNPPAPTPAPPPGTWELTGTGCVTDGNCISSKNHPSNYGNSEDCTVRLSGTVSFKTEAFSTESRYDILSMGGSSYSGTAGPPSGQYTGSITWASDYSVTKSGWRICRN